jgi:hypothetical protein
MPAKEPFHPKVQTGNLGERKKKHGMFQNIPSYPELGGFYGASKYPTPDRPLALEKGDLVRKGRPI